MRSPASDPARRAAQRRERRNPRALPHAQAARSSSRLRPVARACPRLYLSRGRGRHRACRGSRSSWNDQGRPQHGPHMREFWVASGHHLTHRADHGGLVATPELIMAYLARPELMPPADACDAEGNLHASLMADPLRPVSRAEIAALADADARENWTLMVDFRDRLISAPSLEALYTTLARKGAGGLPPIFLSQLSHLILRNALEGCDDPYTLRAGELFYRSQLAAIHEGALLLADAEVIEAQQHAQHDMHSSPLTALLQPKPFAEMHVMDDESACRHWPSSDAPAMGRHIEGDPTPRAGRCRVLERW